MWCECLCPWRLEDVGTWILRDRERVVSGEIRAIVRDARSYDGMLRRFKGNDALDVALVGLEGKARIMFVMMRGGSGTIMQREKRKKVLTRLFARMLVKVLDE